MTKILRRRKKKREKPLRFLKLYSANFKLNELTMDNLEKKILFEQNLNEITLLLLFSSVFSFAKINFKKFLCELK